MEKLAATELSSHIGTIEKTRNHAPNHPFSAYLYPLEAVIMFSTTLHGRSILVQLIHAKHLILRRLEGPSKCSPECAPPSPIYIKNSSGEFGGL